LLPESTQKRASDEGLRFPFGGASWQYGKALMNC
jgi:hypothetical protein